MKEFCYTLWHYHRNLYIRMVDKVNRFVQGSEEWGYCGHDTTSADLWFHVFWTHYNSFVTVSVMCNVTYRQDIVNVKNMGIINLDISILGNKNYIWDYRIVKSILSVKIYISTCARRCSRQKISKGQNISRTTPIFSPDFLC